MEAVRGVQTDLSDRNTSASRRRRLDERFYLHFPAVFRLVTGAWMRFPPTSRLRRLMLAQFFRAGYAAGNRRDFPVLRLGMDPDFEYRPAPEMLVPDHQPVFYGHEGYERLWRHWLDAFEAIRLEPKDALDLGHEVLVTAHVSVHGTRSGMSLSQPLFQLYHLRRGFVIRQDDFTDRAQALEAVGVRE